MVKTAEQCAPFPKAVRGVLVVVRVVSALAEKVSKRGLALQVVGSLRLVDRIEHIDGEALIEGEADRKGKDEPQEGLIV